MVSVLFMNFSSETLKGRISQAGEKIKIKGKNVVKFKPGKTLRNKVQTIIVYQDILKG